MNVEIGTEAAAIPRNFKDTNPLTLSLAAPFAPPCQEALGLIGPKKGEKTGFDDVS